MRIFPEPIGDTARFRHDPVRFIRLDSCGAAANPHRNGARYLRGTLFLFVKIPRPEYLALPWEATGYPAGPTWHWDAIVINGPAPWDSALAMDTFSPTTDTREIGPAENLTLFLLEQLILLAARDENAITADMAPAPFTPTPME